MADTEAGRNPRTLSRANTQSNMTDARENWSTSINLSPRVIWICIIVSVAKIIPSAIILKDAECWGQQQAFQICMMVYDGICLILNFIKLWNVYHTVSRVNEHQENRPDGATQPSSLNPEAEALIKKSDATQPPAPDHAQVLALARAVTARQKAIDMIAYLAELYYFGIFIWAHVIIGLGPSLPCFYLPAHKLLIAFIVLGWVSYLMPCLCCCLMCCCLPCFVFFLAILAPPEHRQHAADQAVISLLPVQKYSTDVQGTPECAICMQEYKSNDNVIIFKCSPLHHFHEDCCKRWLRVNGECPLCRKRVEDMAW